MSSLIDRFRAALSSAWRSVFPRRLSDQAAAPEKGVPVLEAPGVVAANEGRATIKHEDRAKDITEAARWYHLGDILEQLDDYRFYLRRLKRHSLEMYKTYSRLGAFIASSNEGAGTYFGPSPTWAKGRQRPSIGAVFWLNSKAGKEDAVKTDSVLPKLMFFEKVSSSFMIKRRVAPLGVGACPMAARRTSNRTSEANGNSLGMIMPCRSRCPVCTIGTSWNLPVRRKR